MYPARATLEHVIKAWWKVAWQKAGKTLPVFLFREWTQQHKLWRPKLKSNDFQSYPRRETAASGGKKCYIRKGLCKSFIQWFWELNLCSYKYQVHCFDSLRLFFCCCWSESLEYNKTLNVRSLGKPVSFVFPRVLMFPSILSRETSEQDSQEKKLFPSGSDIKCKI